MRVPVDVTVSVVEEFSRADPPPPFTGCAPPPMKQAETTARDRDERHATSKSPVATLRYRRRTAVENELRQKRRHVHIHFGWQREG